MSTPADEFEKKGSAEALQNELPLFAFAEHQQRHEPGLSTVIASDSVSNTGFQSSSCVSSFSVPGSSSYSSLSSSTSIASSSSVASASSSSMASTSSAIAAELPMSIEERKAQCETVEQSLLAEDLDPKQEVDLCHLKAGIIRQRLSSILLQCANRIEIAHQLIYYLQPETPINELKSYYRINGLTLPEQRALQAHFQLYIDTRIHVYESVQKHIEAYFKTSSIEEIDKSYLYLKMQMKADNKNFFGTFIKPPKSKAKEIMDKDREIVFIQEMLNAIKPCISQALSELMDKEYLKFLPSKMRIPRNVLYKEEIKAPTNKLLKLCRHNGNRPQGLTINVGGAVAFEKIFSEAEKDAIDERTKTLCEEVTKKAIAKYNECVELALKIDDERDKTENESLIPIILLWKRYYVEIKSIMQPIHLTIQKIEGAKKAVLTVLDLEKQSVLNQKSLDCNVWMTEFARILFKLQPDGSINTEDLNPLIQKNFKYFIKIVALPNLLQFIPHLINLRARTVHLSNGIVALAKVSYPLYDFWFSNEAEFAHNFYNMKKLVEAYNELLDWTHNRLPPLLKRLQIAERILLDKTQAVKEENNTDRGKDPEVVPPKDEELERELERLQKRLDDKAPMTKEEWYAFLAEGFVKRLAARRQKRLEMVAPYRAEIAEKCAKREADIAKFKQKLEEREALVISNLRLTPTLKELFSRLYNGEFTYKDLKKLEHSLQEQDVQMSIRFPNGGSSHFTVIINPLTEAVGVEEGALVTEKAKAWALKENAQFPRPTLKSLQLGFTRAGFSKVAFAKLGLEFKASERPCV